MRKTSSNSFNSPARSRDNNHKMGSNSNSNPKHTATFRPGAAVEVSSDEPGFQGSFFTATVLKALASPPDSYLVQYQTLLSSSSSPLQEVATASHLRPPPPPETNPSRRRRRFLLGDEVDVYHNDGWWAAVVTADLGGGEFELFFRGYKEQMVCSDKDFRVHRDWLDGVWVPPLDHDDDGDEALVIQNGDGETTQEKFEKGMSVEVSSNEEGFEGAWFAATIVEPVGKQGKFLVQYQSLMADDDENFLREEIDILVIRPRPPKTVADSRFKLLDEVDCLYNDGWWVGVVSGVISESRYSVYFKGNNEVMEFDASDMRLHREWIGGKWVVASRVLKL